MEVSQANMSQSINFAINIKTRKTDTSVLKPGNLNSVSAQSKLLPKNDIEKAHMKFKR